MEKYLSSPSIDFGYSAKNLVRLIWKHIQLFQHKIIFLLIKNLALVIKLVLNQTFQHKRVIILTTCILIFKAQPVVTCKNMCQPEI